jgi:hypothetical protein
MIWLPDGDEVPDREKRMIQSPKLVLTFVWNSMDFKLLMPCHAMPKQEMFTAAYDLRNILTEIVARCGER